MLYIILKKIIIVLSSEDIQANGFFFLIWRLHFLYFKANIIFQHWNIFVILSTDPLFSLCALYSYKLFRVLPSVWAYVFHIFHKSSDFGSVNGHLLLSSAKINLFLTLHFFYHFNGIWETEKPNTVFESALFYQVPTITFNYETLDYTRYICNKYNLWSVLKFRQKLICSS